MKHLDIWVFSILFLVINHSSFSHCDDSSHKFRQRKVTNDDLNYPEMVSRYLNEKAGEATVGNDQALVTTGDPSSKSFRDSDQYNYGYDGGYGYYGGYGGAYSPYGPYSQYGYFGYYDCNGYYHYCGHR